MDGADRIVLTSETQPAAGAHGRSTFVVSTSGNSAVGLKLSAVGCSCYRVLHGDRTLKVGDELAIEAGESEEIRIESQPRASAGVMQHRAEFTGRDEQGATFHLPLTSTVRTVADLLVRPDVIHHAVGAAPSERSSEIELFIEQHVRSTQPDELRVSWGAVPDWIAHTPPTLREHPVEILPGLWRARWRSGVRVKDGAEAAPESPAQLRLESFDSERLVAQTECTLLLKHLAGIQAPALVHFGRLRPGATRRRRVQLVARDKQEFAITSIRSRDGRVEATEPLPTRSSEHWLEIGVLDGDSAVDDELTVRTDHADRDAVRIRVRALAPVREKAAAAATVHD